MVRISWPRRGSLAFYPRKKAKRQHPQLRSVKKTGEAKPGYFLGYKAGMSHVLAVDTYEKSPSYGQTISLPVTFIECPENRVIGIKAYTQRPEGTLNFTTLYTEKQDKEITRKTKAAKNSKPDEVRKKIQDNLPKIQEIRLIVETQPKKIMLKKTPEIIEVPFTTEKVEDQWAKAQELLGKEIKVSEVLQEGTYLDTTSITTGRGTEGPLRRFGLKRQRHKAKGHIRNPGSIGAWHPARVLWTVAMTGQKGYQRRTELNKRLLKISDKPEDANPVSGFRSYGTLKTDYLIIKGSIGGPKKRLIALRPALREKHATPMPEIKSISTIAQNR
ncbi:MAG: 50S ribosomal protein L3 [DPANN group archaeon]|nr:50S ribosomal protein L3 [DPANN group archaeon]